MISILMLVVLLDHSNTKFTSGIGTALIKYELKINVNLRS